MLGVSFALMTVSQGAVLRGTGTFHWIFCIEPPIQGIDFSEVVCARWKKAAILASHKVLGSIPVLHELQSVDELLWNHLKEKGKCSLGGSQ